MKNVGSVVFNSEKHMLKMFKALLNVGWAMLNIKLSRKVLKHIVNRHQKLQVTPVK